MQLQERINAFVKLGDFLSQFSNEVIQKKESITHINLFFEGFKNQLKLAEEDNGWFSKENMAFAIKGWTESLSFENLNKWLSPYKITNIKPKSVAIIMAGNIPLVGFHDFLSVLICGHHALIKQSSNDNTFFPI